MPPVRRKNSTARQGAESVNEPSLNDLRQQCRDKGLSDQGRKNTLIARLQQHASTSSSESCNVNTATGAAIRVGTISQSEQPTIETISTPLENSSESPLLNNAQLAHIQSIITQTVQQSVNDIATNAARAAVQAMASTPVPTPTSDAHQSELLDNATAILQTGPEMQHGSPPILPAPTTCLPYGKSFHDVPASYVKKIQSGEFFELSKLLPKNLFNATDEQPVMLTLENSVIKVKPANQSTTTVTDIEQWTTAFTTYMSVFTHAFPNRTQELLQYMSIIRHAAHRHKGVGWCIYDVKFRRKAALDQSINWSELDQQLWLILQYTKLPSKRNTLFSTMDPNIIPPRGPQGASAGTSIGPVM